MSVDQVAELLQGYTALEQANKTIKQTFELQIRELQNQLDWFKRQLFGEKSERRINLDNPSQGDLLKGLAEPVAAREPEKETISYERRKAKKDRTGSLTDNGLRFDETVPVEEIRMPAPELDGPDAEQYVVIDEKVTHRLAQRPGSYVVLKYIQPVVKHKPTQVITTHSAPAGLFDKSLADVSFIVGMLVDKFLYHQPLYRQHLKLGNNGITLSRSTLTNLTHRSIALLRPIYDALLQGILLSKVLAMDETGIKAGRGKAGKMKQGWFWPVLGDEDEIAFIFAPSRGQVVVKNQLNGFSGTLISDGYRAYDRYAQSQSDITHAQCWAHTRRYFVKAEKSEPQRVAEALEMIGQLYAHQKACAPKKMPPEKVHAYRQKHSLPVVDEFFAWCRGQRQRVDLLPSDPFTKAIEYASKREKALRVFLSDPAVPLDTNHIERALRVIPMGRKNWLFCSTEIGAEYVGIIQSLIVTCRMHNVDPYTYLVDVLQRVGQHPANRVAELTPRNWKQRFEANPLLSDLARLGKERP